MYLKTLPERVSANDSSLKIIINRHFGQKQQTSYQAYIKSSVILSYALIPFMDYTIDFFL